MGWLADRWPKKHVMLLIYLIVAATIPLLWAAPSPLTLRVAAFVFGVGLGGDYMIIPLMAAELFGLQRMGRVMGIVLTADGVAEAVVPMAWPRCATAPAATARASPCSSPWPSWARWRCRSSPFTSRPRTDRISPWQDTLDPRSTSVSARPARRKSRRPRRSAALSARKEKAEGRQPAAEDPDLAGIVPGPQPLPWGDDELPS